MQLTHRQQLVENIMAISFKKLSTKEIVELTGITKQGWMAMMNRLGILPCEIVKARGPTGMFIWNMKEAKKALAEEVRRENFR